MLDSSWEEKLRYLVDLDLQMRNLLLEKGILSDAYHPEMEKIHINNANKLQKLIIKKGLHSGTSYLHRGQSCLSGGETSALWD